MTGFEAYKIYVAIKQHFNPANKYNYVQFKGNLKPLNVDKYEERNDRFYFELLGKKKKQDIIQFLVAFILDNDSEDWIGDMDHSTSEDSYLNWKKRMESLTYLFTEDIKEVNEFLIARGYRFDRLFEVEDGQHPLIFRFTQQKMINVETYIIMNQLLHFTVKFKKEIKDPYIFPAVQYKYDRYADFLSFDMKKYGDIMKGVFLNAGNE